MTDAPLAFKDHAFSVYRVAGVEEACVALQDQHDLDVVMLLYLCWLGRHGVVVENASLARAVKALEGWRREVVVPLRQVRRALKTDIGAISAAMAADYRQTIKAAELEAEVLQIQALQALAEHLSARDGRPADRAGVIRGNFARYLSMMGVKRDAQTTAELELVLKAGLDV